MHDYNPLAVFAFVALSITLGTALIFVLARMEPTAPAPGPATESDRPLRVEGHQSMVRRARTLALRRVGPKTSISPVSISLEAGSNPTMTTGRSELASR